MTPYSGSDTFPSAITFPDDGDAFSAGVMNTASKANADRTTWIKNRLPTASNSYSWEDAKTTDVPSTYHAFTSASYSKPPSGGFVDIPGVEVGDAVLVSAQIQAEVEGTQSGIVRLYSIEDYGLTDIETAIDSAKAWFEPKNDPVGLINDTEVSPGTSIDNVSVVSVAVNSNFSSLAGKVNEIIAALGQRLNGFHQPLLQARIVCATAGTMRIGIEGKLVSGAGPLILQGSQNVVAVHLKAA